MGCMYEIGRILPLFTVQRYGFRFQNFNPLFDLFSLCPRSVWCHTTTTSLSPLSSSLNIPHWIPVPPCNDPLLPAKLGNPLPSRCHHFPRFNQYADEREESSHNKGFCAHTLSTSMVSQSMTESRLTISMASFSRAESPHAQEVTRNSIALFGIKLPFQQPSLALYGLRTCQPSFLIHLPSRVCCLQPLMSSTWCKMFRWPKQLPFPSSQTRPTMMSTGTRRGICLARQKDVRRVVRSY